MLAAFFGVLAAPGGAPKGVLDAASDVSPLRAGQMHAWNRAGEWNRSDHEMLALLDHPATRRFLRRDDDGSGLYRLSARTLLDRLRDEFDATELVHNFDANGWEDQGYSRAGFTAAKPMCGFDVTVDNSFNRTAWPNMWQLYRAGDLGHPDQSVIGESEERLFGFTPFASGGNGLPTKDEAADRLNWGGLNLYRRSTGNPACGPIMAIFSRAVIGEHALVTPVDSGLADIASDSRDLGSESFSRVVNPTEVSSHYVHRSLDAASTRKLPAKGSSDLVSMLPMHLRAFHHTRWLAGQDLSLIHI